MRYEHYPIVYTAKIALTDRRDALRPARLPAVSVPHLAAGDRRRRGRRRALDRALPAAASNAKLLEPLGLESLLGLGDRPAYNPLDQLAATPAWAYTFLAIRFVGLALVVPIIEEFFLRGFLMRFVDARRLVGSPLRRSDDRWPIVVGTLFPC